MKNTGTISRVLIGLIVFIPLLLLVFLVRGFTQAPAVNWVAGPGFVNLGDNIAEIDLGADQIWNLESFLPGEYAC